MTERIIRRRAGAMLGYQSRPALSARLQEKKPASVCMRVYHLSIYPRHYRPPVLAAKNGCGYYRVRTMPAHDPKKISIHYTAISIGSWGCERAVRCAC
ncbi:hypothetical protein SERLADRAFT_475193 [Serpula lacrymans var. lacrymans S7.9]|uniref:Uncharacterized protein n=1 Tax=Serpula lacrymans var. lacrymans (strain S7.9) TaxID=578457 RepID=F8P601_SERL9|nr:uncharacterized protein SERLADRAFT_475193 [Serpula lacrymans var. lacrymans S7.9]EGO22038.1 hypothetical protein SERLADRAFT_475193 [Serpula lacrymans var. lacrymans S7.9]